jgi:hypothetical protein
LENLPANEAKCKRERRKPLLRERVRRAIARAGLHGRTAASLAVELYGEDTPRTRARISCTIANLRFFGAPIRRVKDPQFLTGRYVFFEQERKG